MQQICNLVPGSSFKDLVQYKTVQHTVVQCAMQKRSQNATESSALYHSITIQCNANINCPKMQQFCDVVALPVAVLLLAKMALMGSPLIVTLSAMMTQIEL